MAYLAVLIFLLTIGFVIWQPKGLNIAWSTSAGALLALLCGVVSFADVGTVTGIVWNATLAFIGIILISIVLDSIGFFEWSALHMARLANGNGRRLFVYVILLGATVSAFFANDGAALILTPIVLAMVRALKLPERMVLPFIMASGFIADTMSIPFVISNLVNIVSADFFDINFATYASRMVVTGLISLGGSLLVLYTYYHKQIPREYNIAQAMNPRDAIKDLKLFRLSWWILGVLLVAYMCSGFVHIRVSLLVGAAALSFVMIARASPAVNTRKILKEAPWSIVIFSIGMYVVVYGLKNAGFTDALANAIGWMTGKGLFAATVGMGFLSAVLSSVMNNLPTVLIGSLAVQGVHAEGIMHEALVYANVIGSDLGPKMTPIGSLATLIWLHVLSRKGVKITWGAYFKTGVVLTVPTLLITLIGLYVWLHVVA
ncbi:arsenic transporter [Paenibacillus ferrarius]|uniref:arsenic transporter n=1 Tax=Paenibacillus ferrarius TaxID=1469647 RepID=UPI003D2D5225